MRAPWPPPDYDALQSRMPPRLKVGERIRMEPGGPVCEVRRVSFTGATVSFKVLREFEATDPLTGEKKLVKAGSMKLTTISAYAFVERVKEGEKS